MMRELSEQCLLGLPHEGRETVMLRSSHLDSTAWIRCSANHNIPIRADIEAMRGTERLDTKDFHHVYVQHDSAKLIVRYA